MADNELVHNDNNAFAIMDLQQDELKELIQANMGQQGVNPFMLERVKTPAGGSIFWSVPTLDGEQPMKEIEGVIIHYRDMRAYWSKRPGEGGLGNVPPECISEDSVVGVGSRWEGDEDKPHDCLTCRHAQFSSDPKGGKGQACGAKKALYVLRKESILPLVFLLPATSIQPVERYFLKLLSYKMPFYGCTTKITLEQKQNVTGQPYSRVVCGKGRTLTPEECAKVKVLRESIVPALNKTRVRLEESDAEKAPF